MSVAKIQVKLGAIEFGGEGEEKWLTSQLDKIIESAPKLIAIVPTGAQANGGGGQSATNPAIGGKSLAAFLKEKNALSNQVRKFLATAIWLGAKGKSQIVTADVTKALKDAGQSRLSNPADCLLKNASKGHCEKDGSGFFVTEEGKASL